MESTNIISILSLAFGLGIIHALDADHIMAVSGLASTRSNTRNCITFCLRWAMGHGTSLMIIGISVFAMGLAIPHTLSHYAEHAVGFLLIAIGIWIIWTLLRTNAHLHFHKHDGLPQHAHWHQHDDSHSNSDKNTRNNRANHFDNHDNDPHQHQHSAILVGVLHGAAGSAPLLVLIPMAKLDSPWIGITYLVIFSLGVLLAMLFFGGMLGNLYKQLSKWGDKAVRLLRLVIATSAIGFGIHLVAGSL